MANESLDPARGAPKRPGKTSFLEKVARAHGIPTSDLYATSSEGREHISPSPAPEIYHRRKEMAQTCEPFTFKRRSNAQRMYAGRKENRERKQKEKRKRKKSS